MHTVSTRLAYLGIQVALRKTRPPAQHPGPWSGAMVSSDHVGIGVKATTDKWLKTKEQLRTTLQWIDSGGPISRNELESFRGSLVYLQRTYPAITPYVKGFHLTIDSWRWNRDAEGWITPSPTKPKSNANSPPTHVTPVPRLRDNVVSLLSLFASEDPRIQYVRAKTI
jgi:hypothetical protein